MDVDAGAAMGDWQQPTLADRRIEPRVDSLDDVIGLEEIKLELRT